MSNIGFVTIGAIDGEQSGKFYDAVFAALGSERKLNEGGWLSYGRPRQVHHGLPHLGLPAP